MVAYKFEETEWPEPKKQGCSPHETLGDIRFRQLFTQEDWSRLPAPVRHRFGRRVGFGDTLIYRGHVEFNRVNGWGRLLTQALRLVGAPLPLDRDNAGAAAVVTVTEAPSKNGRHGGQVWMRQYARRNAKRLFPQIIQSVKRFEGPTGIEEYIGGGIGMTLRAAIEDKELVFIAEDIFWDATLLGRQVRLRLPRWLGPKLLRAGHEELGGGAFAFTLRLEHKWFGKMIDQRVWFEDDLT